MQDAPKPVVTPLPVPAEDLLGALTADVLRMLETVRVPAYIVDCHRRVRWQNTASIDFVGDLRGRLDANVGLDPKDLGLARDAFTRKQNGAAHAEVEVTVARRDGKRVRIAISTVPLRNGDGTMIGSFGLVQMLEELESSAESAPALSARERQTLVLLAAGYSTAQMAQELGISTETVRNHVKRVLRRLDASSRVEAVAKGRSVGLI